MRHSECTQHLNKKTTAGKSHERTCSRIHILREIGVEGRRCGSLSEWLRHGPARYGPFRGTALSWRDGLAIGRALTH
ncbi:hypothetical protein IG631_02879 [Alternaria alternata]|nr:hypothetical protein IG631_02879 [Alternaria alternata]